MSNVKIQGNSSGTGTLTIAAPNTNSDFTLNLPASAGTIPVLSSVTNNGVVYVNSSGQATSGSGLVFDNSGNLGLGVTPSAWGSSTVIENLSGMSIGYVNGGHHMTSNAYFNGTNWIYKTSASAANYYQNSSGQHIWRNAAAGTAGGTVTFTQAMTLDASGNLGVGTTSPSARLHLYAAANEILRLESSSTSYDAALRIFQNGTQITNLQGGVGVVGGGTFLTTVTSAPLVFGTVNTERARIDSSGNFFLGKTASNTTTVGFEAAPTGYARCVNAASTNGITVWDLYSTGAGAYRFYVGMGGTIYATSTSISAISDASLKENIRDLETGLPEVMALKPRRFDWKNGDAKNVAGFVAQEVEQVLPELVTDYIYNKDEDGNDIIKKSLKMGDILPTLVKAIQEQQAIINAQSAALEQLKARLDAANL